jgi:hypothetical protein
VLLLIGLECYPTAVKPLLPSVAPTVPVSWDLPAYFLLGIQCSGSPVAFPIGVFMESPRSCLVYIATSTLLLVGPDFCPLDVRWSHPSSLPSWNLSCPLEF